jgi:tetratricopeptide (TPR) repeat protein
MARVAGLLFSIAYAAFIVWLYAAQPQTVGEVTGGITSSVGAYRVDPQSMADGLAFFRRDRFDEARAAFERADPARRDPTAQFYIAYSYYRQGWGRFYSDDALFAKGIEAVDRAIRLAPSGRLVVDDPALGMRSADELKAELERGRKRELSDFNPLRVLERRK